MAEVYSCPLPPNFNMYGAINFIRDQLTAQGYNVMATPMGPTSGTLQVSKDNDGIKQFLGMGVSCDVSLTVVNNVLNVNIQSEWTNKIIAMAVGWFLCWIPFITGIIGCVNQNSLPGKIKSTINVACSYQ